ncbi:NAD+ synthase [Alkalinema pantanalense CENA528]|uniref:NAD+ synthase n=1 Tax=Alkalinema pantanalense TaxID=1620705 RepID=UPI003D6E35B7
MKIAIAQLNPTIGDLPNNAQAIVQAAQQAAAQGARLLLTPELSLCGYPPRDLLLNPSFIAELSDMLQTIAQQLPQGLVALIGTVEVNPQAAHQGGKPLFNSVALIENSQVKQVFHKRLLPTYDVFDEDRYFAPGNQPNHFYLDGLHIGLTVCEDLWNDEEFWGKRNYADNPIADLAELQVAFTVNLSASPYSIGKQRIRERMLQHTAQRFNQPIVYANQVGANDDLIFDGGSFAVNRDGSLVSRAQCFATDLLLLEYDVATHNLVSQVPASPTALPTSTDAEIWLALVLGVRDYARKCGFTQAVLGLSGGIDSALVAAIAAAALGADNVLGILMPSPYSSDHSITDALDLAHNLGIKTQTIPIGAAMEAFDRSLADIFAGTEFGVAEENIQSRIRGTLLMGVANKFGYLLISTGNKSEMAVGYCTLYGDMNGGLAAIADVPKTRVYSLCEWLNQQVQQGQVHNLAITHLPTTIGTEIIPTHILTKPPSAELKPGQVDQDSLPPYDVLDDILARLVENHESAEQIIAAGFDRAVVQKIARLVKIAEFKRRQAAPGLKITDRAFGTGWRMPIAQRWLPTGQVVSPAK